MKTIFLILLSLNCFAESRKKIVVLDTGANLSQRNKSYLCDSKQDFSFSSFNHGQNIIGLIGERINIKKYCIVSIKIYNNSLRPSKYVSSLKSISKIKNVVAVNLSLSGTGYLQVEHWYIYKMTHSGIKVFVSAGNNKEKLTEKKCNIYPACLKLFYMKNPNFVVVGSSTGNYSNYSDYLPIKLRDGTKQGNPAMTGTSQSTAIYAGELFNQ